ncbi:zinc finger protein 91-like [Temnothorax curvispinosus]|uniref:Zinc finger protein 91-like n=1 Tax=Temnothorax curvispinosus TaxID=300111 RepID=A0A6J1RA98_9HYME|nr:zinc finger protein 91-like [Temnothorax curvispinosus]
MDAVEINTSGPPQGEDAIASGMKICRVCLLGNLMMRDLFLESEVASLSAKAMSFANVKMLPGDGLPAQVCCMCAAKLESAYEFKLQVEQADNVLRGKLVGGIIKEELFLNEVEIHLDAERNDNIEEISVSTDYESTTTVLPVESAADKNFLKNQLMILEAEKLSETEEIQQDLEQDNSRESIVEELQQELADAEDNDISDGIDESRAEEVSSDENIIRSCTDAIPTEEHDYIMQQCSLPAEQLSLQEEMQENVPELEQDTLECQETSSEQNQEIQVEQNQEIQAEEDQEIETEQIHEIQAEQNQEIQAEINQEIQVEINQEIQAEINQEIQAELDQEAQAEQENQAEQNQNDTEVLFKEETLTANTDEPVEQESSQNETRRSKRRLARRIFTERNSDEENYFENLNLSSRLKKAQSDKTEKIFFMCYLCDKQFLSKNVLKEHMHSHEEVRKTLSLKKTPEKPQKVQASASAKTPPSGKKANKCPYCGKEYLYINSFTKHIKQHEREREEAKEDPMPLEISFHEDEHSLDFDSGNRSDSECKKRKRGNTADDDTSDSDQDKRRKRSHVEEFACDKCSEKFDTKRGLHKHSITHVSFECSVCNEEYDTLEQLRNHRTKHVVEGVLTEQDLEEDMKQMKSENNDEDNKNIEIEERNGEPTENTKELKCPTCSMTFSRKKALSRHIETTHSSTRSYECKICCQQFTRKDLLRRHAEQHARVKTYKCTQCNKTFGNELTLRNHLVATNHKTFVHGQEYDPNKRIKRVAARAAQKIIDKIKTEDGLEDYDDDNDDNTDYDAKLDGHYRRKRDATPKKYSYKKEFECATCSKRYSTKQALTKHMEQHVKEEKAEKAAEKAAEKLKKAALEKKEAQKKETTSSIGDNDDDDIDSDFESGLDWPMDSHECTTCKKRYSTKKSLLRHQLLHEEPNFECDICNAKFYRKDKLKAHYDKCSEKNPDQVRKCNICGDSFENNEILREHRAKHVTEGILTEEDLRDIEPKSEEKKPGEKIGRKRRTDIVGLECTECNKQYTSRKGLLRHIQVHEGKKYLCDICPKKFYRREHLKIHVAKHNMIKPYKCTRCTKRFIKEEQLNNHLPKHDRTFKKTKETDSSKRFLCEICSKSFTQSTTLIAHLRAHNGIKPYVCEVCSRPFTTNAYLKMHMRTHTQERPYICQYCSRAFARADTLANHLTSHTGEAKYHCKCCPKNFRRLKSLKEHMFIHTGQRPYECPTCDRKFNNNGSRYAHSKRCKQNLLQNQNRAQQMIQQTTQHQQQQQHPQQQQQQQPQPQQVQIQVQQQPHSVRLHQTIGQAQVVKAQNIKTIAIARPAEPTTVTTAQQVMQHQEILMPLILPLTVTLTDVGEEVILPEGTKIYTTS